jgi:SpoVK/Ycf46/Vps4 family AAA+-type ATPase
LVQATAGYSGADLTALCREAGLHAIRRGLAAGMTAKRLVLTRQDMDQALFTLRTKREPEPLAVLRANVLRASQERDDDVYAHRSANQSAFSLTIPSTSIRT